ncbi:MAG TPA: GNAT family N-acetyltransferase [Albitalea sp.]|uniref:GNAT family N-acetyltransferase n=1 Tax=Piscinibacter sp. TaxID=1903157 RepID=UPI002ED2F496
MQATIRIPTHVPASQLETFRRDFGDGVVITHSSSNALSGLLPASVRGSASPNESATATITHAPGNQPIDVQVSRLQDVEPEIRDKLLSQMGPLFSAQWSDVDDRYASPQGVMDVLTKRMESTDPCEQIVVAHHGGELVSTASLVKRDNPAFADRYRDDGGNWQEKYSDGWLADVYTVEKYRRQGHAAGMIAQVRTAAANAGLEKIHLYTDAATVPYYLKRDFGVVGNEIVPPEPGTNGMTRQATETIMCSPPPQLTKVKIHHDALDADRAKELKNPRVDKDLPDIPPLHKR